VLNYNDTINLNYLPVSYELTHLIHYLLCKEWGLEAK